ncbi:Serine/threonine-protein phosphatase bsl1 [Lathyrus oleraceus]|uniref:protein-serine/threonine phosphatase n=3 Tax=Pisum sativum TaxID=3888 RepID=A0A9D5A9E6_PEA|nr:Serine/threonine-protein phosphatase bsl1 [Pisum sativum]
MRYLLPRVFQQKVHSVFPVLSLTRCSLTHSQSIFCSLTHSRTSKVGDDLPPIVLVHGIFGFGKGRLGGLSYFAGAEKKDERVLVPDLGSLTSIYDRARELFYYLKGGQVDYGEEHSKECGHSQFGRIYEQEHYSEWDEDHPLHFVGHSAGAQVVRVLQQMLVDKIMAFFHQLNFMSFSASNMSEDGKTLKPICLLQLCRIGVILYDWLDIAWLKNYYNFGFDHFNMSWRKIGVWGLVDCLLGNAGFDKYSLEKLREASAAEAEAASAVWQSVQAISSSPVDETSVSDDNSHAADTVADGSDTKGDVHLHPRAVVVAKEAIGNLGGMVRQLSLDQFENESRRMLPINSDSPYPTKKFTRQKSPQGLHKKIISNLLRPRNWKAPANRRFFLDSYEVGELCYAAEQIFMHEPTVLQLKAPVKVFGDLHGQFGDLMRLFDEYGFPSTAGDITKTCRVMLCVKLICAIEYPDNVHLICGNHEAADINALFGFRIECIKRMDGTNEQLGIIPRAIEELFRQASMDASMDARLENT